MLQEKSHEFNIPAYAISIDFKKAFDTIELSAIWQALESFDVDDNLIKAIQLLYANGSAAVKIGESQAVLNIQRGVRQGDPLSPLLFTITLQYALNKMNFCNRGFKINGKTLPYLAYADDIVLLSNDRHELENMARDLTETSKQIGLTINFEKTKWMKLNNTTDMDEEIIEVEGQTIRRVYEYVYLGQLISQPRNQLKEIRRRIQAGRSIFFRHRLFLKSQSVAIDLKRKFVNTCILPAVLYGCETWTWTKVTALTLRSAQRRLERAMLGVRLVDRVSAKIIRSRTGLKNWIHNALRRKWKYAKKLSLCHEEMWAYMTTSWVPMSKRSKGRPKTRWLDDIAKFRQRNPKELGVDWTTLLHGYMHKSAELFAKKTRHILCNRDKRDE
ncbi:hypothetical protein Aduo_001096 [Ancylostoma duodenale]